MYAIFIGILVICLVVYYILNPDQISNIFKQSTTTSVVKTLEKQQAKQDKSIDNNAKALGLDPKEIKEAAGITCAYPLPCGKGFQKNKDGTCCEVIPDKELSAKEQKIMMATEVGKAVVTGVVVEAALKFAARGGRAVGKAVLKGTTKQLARQLGKKAAIIAARISAKIGQKLGVKAATNLSTRIAARAGVSLAAKTGVKVGTKVAAKAGAKTATKGASMLTKLKPGPMAVFDMASLTLDIFDPGGYNLFQSNKINEHLRNSTEVAQEKMAKESALSYPYTFPLSEIFPEEMDEAMAGLMPVFFEDVLAIIEQKHPDKFDNIMESIVGDAEMTEEEDELFSNTFIDVMNNNAVKRDKEIHKYLKTVLSKSELDKIEFYEFMSTKERQGLTLSEIGVKEWNRDNRDKWLKPDPNSETGPPPVALYTDTFRILDMKNPGKPSKPNVIEKKLPGKTALSMYISDVYKNCEGTLKGGLIPGAKPSVTPYQFGVRFNDDNGLCNYTKRWCSRMGLTYVKKGITNCKSAPGAGVAAFLLGDTVTKGAIQLGKALEDSYGRGVGKIPKCADGYERKGGFCYKKCKPGYKSSALECEGKCPPGSKNTGLTCLQSTKAYVRMGKKGCSRKTFHKCVDRCTREKEGKSRKKASKKVRKECEEQWECKKDFYYQKLKTVFGKTCVKPCMDGFKRRSNAAGSAFCDKKRPRYSRAGKPKEAKSCKKGYEYDAALCYKNCKRHYYGVGPVCYPCTGLQGQKKNKKKCDADIKLDELDDKMKIANERKDRRNKEASQAREETKSCKPLKSKGQAACNTNRNCVVMADNCSKPIEWSCASANTEDNFIFQKCPNLGLEQFSNFNSSIYDINSINMF